MPSEAEKAIAFKEPALTSHYAKETEWLSMKQAKQGKVTVAECEVHILHLEQDKLRYEKLSLMWQKRTEALEDKLNQMRSDYHTLETDLKLLENDRDNIQSELTITREFRRIVEIFLGIGCCGLGALPSLHPILLKGSSNHVALVADIIIGIICLCLIFVPNIVLKGKRNGN